MAHAADASSSTSTNRVGTGSTPRATRTRSSRKPQSGVEDQGHTNGHSDAVDVTSTGSDSANGASAGGNSSARERILSAAAELFATRGFDGTPTSKIAEQAEVPKGLIHYYFRRKQDLLTALVEQLPDESIECGRIVEQGDLVGSLRRLVRELDEGLESSVLLSHLLWREADTHAAVRQALQDRFEAVVDQIRDVIELAMPKRAGYHDVEIAAVLLARVVNHRHSVARHGEHDDELEREIGFIARGLAGEQ